MNARRNVPSGALQGDWAPDGRRIVFAGYDRVRNRVDVYAMEADGTNIMRLTRDASTKSSNAGRIEGSLPPPRTTGPALAQNRS